MSGSRSPSSIGGSPSGTGGSMKNGRSIAALVTRMPTDSTRSNASSCCAPMIHRVPGRSPDVSVQVATLSRLQAKQAFATAPAESRTRHGRGSS